MRTSGKLVSVCAGAPIAALCFGGATAWAAPSTIADSSEATAAQQTTNGGFAVSAGGTNVAQFGNSSATTTGRSLAVAFDLPNAARPSTATANGNGNFALALNGSTATANGSRNFVFAGDDSTASATGNNNDVRAAFGSTNRVTGNDNTSYAIPHSDAVVDGNNNLAVSLCGGSVTISAQGQRITSAPCLGG